MTYASNLDVLVDWQELRAVGDELQATDKQVVYALNRAMRRTATTLYRMAAKGLTKTLHLRAMKVLRKRLRTNLKSGMNKTGKKRVDDGVRLWFGLNDLPVSSFKDKPKETGAGAVFRDQEYAGAFVARPKGQSRPTIFKRKGADRLPIVEQLYPIDDKAMKFIEDEIWDDIEDIFWNHFQRDLRARVTYNIGAS